MADTFIQDRITAVEAIIVAYETTITALTTTGVQRYVLDTGQSRQDVTKADIPKLTEQLDGLYNTRFTLKARLDGSGSGIVRPGW